jgi:hypothetical protein
MTKTICLEMITFNSKKGKEYEKDQKHADELPDQWYLHFSNCMLPVNELPPDG